MRFAIEPKPNEPRGDILLPDARATRSPSSTRWSTPTWSASTPRSATSRWPGSTSPHGIAQALWQGKLFHIDLNGQTGPSTTRTSCSATATCSTPSPRSTCSRTAAPAAARPTTARATSTTSRCAPRTTPACGSRPRRTWRTYLLLKERAAAFRADPEVQEALAASQVAELAVPTLYEGESYADLLADSSAWEEFDADAVGAPGLGFVRLNQLAIEHLLGFRG